VTQRLRPLGTLTVALFRVIGAGCGSNAPSETGTAGTGATEKATDRDIDNSALIGYPAARGTSATSAWSAEQTAGPPSSIYVRAATGHEAAVQSLLARTANPEAPNEADVSQPSDALTAQAAAAGAFDSLFLGLGVVALIVGAVGVADIMIISALERRSEIGLRRALGATKAQIRTQFLAESILLAVIGGVVGVLAGAAATAVYASSKSWAVVIPAEARRWTCSRGAPARCLDGDCLDAVARRERPLRSVRARPISSRRRQPGDLERVV